MTRTMGARFLTGVVRLADLLHLRWALTGIVHSLPPAVRLRLGRLQVRLAYMQGLALVPEQELQRSYEAALALLGDRPRGAGSTYLEFGVFVGTSMACMYRAAARSGIEGLRFVGFDSFQGMPEGVEDVDDRRWHEGELYSDMKLTRENLQRLGVPPSRIELVPGWFEDTLTDETSQRLGLQTATVVMFDCVLSTSTRLGLEFCTGLIDQSALFYFDDWDAGRLADQHLGERAAFEEWLAEHPEFQADELPELAYGDDAHVFQVRRVATA